ncbi:hypothetical protein RWV98_03415 [Agathobaculum sp. NTUH-O15-33]|uniref:hypothetical protein n=1 Tax=Agathobaculum sp. NTUH-O15-33 TaxID=3079302 RepID=UPI002958CFAB|nr:hypothetical protein [Agathobaculum sp. NTUH-O15-33]WNX85336.1 hypothetical protein RWV98_03415 [Agathobaculum sp. NTUH-O15-33]
MKKQQRKKQTLRFLKWIRRYGGWWYLICTPNDEHMNADMMIMLIKRLAKEGFYEIIFVLLMVHREDELLQSANKEMLLELMIDEWKMDRQDELVQKLIYYIE